MAQAEVVSSERSTHLVRIFHFSKISFGKVNDTSCASLLGLILEPDSQEISFDISYLCFFCVGTTEVRSSSNPTILGGSEVLHSYLLKERLVSSMNYSIRFSSCMVAAEG